MDHTQHYDDDVKTGPKKDGDKADFSRLKKMSDSDLKELKKAVADELSRRADEAERNTPVERMTDAQFAKHTAQYK